MDKWFQASKQIADKHLANGFAVVVLLPLDFADPPDVAPSSAEITRAARFHFEKDARAHLFARLIARHFLDLTPPDAPFETGKNGKPFHRSVLPFSISHAGEYAAIAITPFGQIGMDIEARADKWDPAKLVDIVCHENEKDWLASLPAGAPRTTGFLRIWTRKEALLKGTGEGLVNDLQGRDTQPQHPLPWLDKNSGLQIWSLKDLPLACAVACDPKVAGIKVIRSVSALPVNLPIE